MTRNEQLARDGYEALMRGEAEVAEALMAPDLTWHWTFDAFGMATRAEIYPCHQGAEARIAAGFVEGAGL
jgi:ketosteroid isomerase-like protein